MIGLVPTHKIYLACGATDMRKGIDGLSVLVQEQLARDPHSGAVFVFRGKSGHLLKILSYDGQGMCLFYKRLDRGMFVWPWTQQDAVFPYPWRCQNCSPRSGVPPPKRSWNRPARQRY